MVDSIDRMQCDVSALPLREGDGLHHDSPSNQELEKEVFDLRQLLEIIKSLSSTLEYHELIDSILHICVAQMRVLRAGILTRKELSSDDLILHRNYIGFDVDHNIEYRVSADHAVYRFLSENTRCFTLGELESHVALPAAIARLTPDLLVPVQAKGELQGVLLLAERIDNTAFTAQEKEYLLNVALFAAIAISNAVLFERSRTDTMTRLKLRHALESSISELRNERRRHPFALVLLDIDHFKGVNDTYGHNVGDEVLKGVADTIRSNVRQNDLAARYGGEEFAVLLPESDHQTAYEIAERIRNSVAERSAKQEGMRIAVTLSAGIAIYDPERDIAMSDFVERADRALYQSKRSGRNRSSVSDHRLNGAGSQRAVAAAQPICSHS